jgi:hypothetical protein
MQRLLFPSAPYCTPAPLTWPQPQACLQPARDLFTRSSQLVASIVVIPLMARSDAPVLGGLYFTFNVPCDFLQIQETVLVRSAVIV